MKTLQEMCLEIVRRDPLHGLQTWRRPDSSATVITEVPETLDIYVDKLLKKLKFSWKLQKTAPESKCYFEPLYRMETGASSQIYINILQHYRKIQAYDSMNSYNSWQF